MNWETKKLVEALLNSECHKTLTRYVLDKYGEDELKAISDEVKDFKFEENTDEDNKHDPDEEEKGEYSLHLTSIVNYCFQYSRCTR